MASHEMLSSVVFLRLSFIKIIEYLSARYEPSQGHAGPVYRPPVGRAKTPIPSNGGFVEGDNNLFNNFFN